MDQDAPRGHDPTTAETRPVRRDGLAAVAVILLTIGLIVLVVSSLV